ncbi:peroxidase family protein [Nocardioides sp.]|uniref:peroxidase family protein n=1 Tax=Nocardioides sp. TaxID=35761 RepID=UPI002D80414D|nr:peroxidase family protein [Nocardioides sp.]HET8961150.1 peroxidase family protein [Nocardioides sp.]
MELLGQGLPRDGRETRRRRTGAGSRRRVVSLTTTLLVGTALTPLTVLAPTAVLAPAEAAVGQGFNLNPSDLEFILKQIEIAEHHAANYDAAHPCDGLMGPGEFQIPTTAQGEELPWGLRTVDGTCNNLVPGQHKFGAADQAFPPSAGLDYREAEPAPPGFPSNATSTGGNSSYARPGSVVDSQPRKISNLIVDQTAGNPAALAAAGPGATADSAGNLPNPNVATDVGLSAPYNGWFTLFGQFFDHGLDLVNKSGGTVFMPLSPGDPLYNAATPQTNFMVVTRSTGSPGGTTNQTATFVDQSQTYTSHPSHQVFLREYVADGNGKPVSDGLMLRGTMADGERDGMATWATVKDQASTLLGIELDDQDALNLPLLATDPYGKFLPGANGFPQLVRSDNTLVEGNPAAPVDASQAVRTGHAFLDDIAHTAVPFGDHDNNPGTPRRPFTPDADTAVNNTVSTGVYDDELLDEHFVAGDGRVNENIGLTAVHHIFHSEHNRLAADPSPGGSGIKDVLVNEDPASIEDWQISPGVWDGERIFQAARFVTEMEYQHLAFEEFVRKVQPMVNAFGEGGTGYNTSINPAIRAEFAHAVYRFGHSMLTETVARREADGTNTSMDLLEAFLNPVGFDEGGTVDPDIAAGSIVRGMSRQTGNEIDEFVTEALRNNLLGLPLDLPAINLARAREAGVPRLNAVRAKFYDESNNSALAPYQSWTDFGFNLKHRESLVNFVAAYGKHPSISGSPANRRLAATRLIEQDPSDPATPADAAAFMNSTGTWNNNTTGMNDVDLWVGGLAEKRMVFGGLLGSTFNYVFELQMEDLQFGDRFYYLSRTAGLNLLTQLEGNSFAEMISRNTDVDTLPADSFSRPDFVFNVGTLTSGSGTTVVDDPLTDDYNEGDRLDDPGRDLWRTGTNGLRYTGPAHAVFNGTSSADRVWASEGDDTIRGNDGDDWMQGGDGVDNLIGGLGDDILNDLFGDDVLKGGDGDDAISSGQGFGGDLNQGGRGRDFIVDGNDMTESFAGPGNDFILGGDDIDTVFGDDGDDWIEGGTGPFNLLQGDNGAPFQDDPNAPGDDVIDGDGGEQDFDAEGGDDIMLGGPGIQRAEGMLGFDWFIHQGDPQAGRSDLNFLGALPPGPAALRDRFDLVEALSGWEHDDVLQGDDRNVAGVVVPGDVPIGAGHGLEPAGIARIPGLQEVLGEGVTSFDTGNLILGGDGSDTLEGRGGDDILDGDKWVHVYLSVRNDAGTEIDTAESMGELKTAVFSGAIDPGNIVIVREILDGTGVGTDKAMFSDTRASYICTDLSGATPQVLSQCPRQWSGGRLEVSHLAGGGPVDPVDPPDPGGVVLANDGTDIVENVEELVFSDSAPPAAPTGVTAVAGNGNAQVSFIPPLSVVDSFQVEVIDQLGQPVGEPLDILDPETTNLLVGDLVNGQPYTFRVRGINAFGTGEWSLPSAPVTPRADAPDAPGVPTVRPGDRHVEVSWTEPADGGSIITGYDLRITQLNGTETLMSTTDTTLDATGLVNGRDYFFSVRAKNAEGTGPWSPEVGAVPRARPGAPTMTSVDPRSHSVMVRWRPPADDGGSDITRYQVQVLTLTGSQVGRLRATEGPVHRLLVKGLENGRPYRFRVKAVNIAGDSPWSGTMKARPH